MEVGSVRPAILDDAAEIARLATELGYPVSATEISERLRYLLGNSRHAVFVIDGRPSHVAGWAHVEHRQSLEGGQRAELMGLIVEPSARGRGIGRRLVEAVELWASTRGLKTLTVRSNVERSDSHPFYAALGYTLDKTQHVYSRSLAS